MASGSPDVIVREIDLTGIVPAVSTTIGALAGVFNWGPVEEARLLSSETELVAQYGKQTSANFETFFTAANFLAYGNALNVSRAISNTAFNAVAGNGTVANTTVKNLPDFQGQTFSANAVFVAKWPGALGNNLKVSTCDNANVYSSNLVAANATYTAAFSTNSNTVVFSVTNANTTLANNAANEILNGLTVGDYLLAGNTSIGQQYLKVTAKGSASAANGVATVSVSLSAPYALAANVSLTNVTRFWEYFAAVSSAPGTSVYATNNGGTGDEIHVVVVDTTGKIKGVAGSILETWEGLSRATDAKSEDGSAIFVKDALNSGSQWVWNVAPPPGVVAYTTASATVATASVVPFTAAMTGGADGLSESAIALADLARAYDIYKSPDDIDISLLMTGKSVGGLVGEGLANYLIDNIAEVRRDCLVTVSPVMNDVVNAPNVEAINVQEFRNAVRSTSFAIMDSGYKYQYDKYNDTYRWVPLNGDIAGLCVRTDQTRDPWFSPAGLNRGIIKNVVRLAYNPDKADRDLLYKIGINPVVNIQGVGPVLYGDKTLLSKPSAFDRINVRRLFIVLEKSISLAAKYSLFEFNDEFTRAQFKNIVEPYLRDILGKRGIYDFRVVCDTTNNTPEVIDRNEFVGDIYIKPARSINWITLNFVAVRTGVEFQTIVGQF